MSVCNLTPQQAALFVECCDIREGYFERGPWAWSETELDMYQLIDADILRPTFDGKYNELTEKGLEFLRLLRI